MTEAEWLAGGEADGWKLRGFLQARGEHLHTAGGRRLRLFACACCRCVWHLLSEDRGRPWLLAAERKADARPAQKPARATQAELRASTPGGLANHAAWVAYHGGVLAALSAADSARTALRVEAQE